MGARDGHSPSGEDLDDPHEQPWASPSTGRHSLGRRAAVVRVEELLRSFALDPQPNQFNETAPDGGTPARTPGGHADADLEAARAEIATLTELLRAAQDELAFVRQQSEADLAAVQAESEDLETAWELRLRELEKELEELAGELAERAEDGQAARDADEVADEIERLRAEAERAHAEAEDAGAEADAAFVELAEAFAALSAAEARLAELESSTTETS